MTESEESDLLKAVADISTDSISKDIYIPIIPKSKIQSLLQLLSIKPKEKKFVLRLARVNTAIKLSAIASKIPETLEFETVLKFAIDNVHIYGEDLILATAYAIQNDKNQIDEDLLHHIRYEYRFETMKEIIDFSMPSIAAAFLSTIVSIKGSSEILKPKTSPE